MSGTHPHISDSGFLDLKSAEWVGRLYLRRIELRESLHDLEGSIAALLDLLDHRGNAMRDDRAAVCQCVVCLSRRDEQGGISRIPVRSIESQDMREQELLEGCDLVLQFIETLTAEVRHGLFSFTDDAQPRQRDRGGHRLCDTAKKTEGDAA